MRYSERLQRTVRARDISFIKQDFMMMSSLLKTNSGINIPVYDGYMNVLVFPSPQVTIKVNYIKSIIEHSQVYYFQNKQNVNLLTMEKKDLFATGQVLFLPFFEGHDYAILPGDKKSILYYDHVPPCLRDYPYLVTLNLPEV